MSNTHLASFKVRVCVSSLPFSLSTLQRKNEKGTQSSVFIFKFDVRKRNTIVIYGLCNINNKNNIKIQQTVFLFSLHQDEKRLQRHSFFVFESVSLMC